MLSVFFFAVNTSAQTFFQTYSGQNLAGSAMISSPDGNLFIGGEKSDSAMVVKIDPDGNVLWSVSFKPTTSANKFYVCSFEITPDNFLIGTGGSFIPANMNPDEGFYFKMDLNGSVQWCKVVTGVSNHFTMRKMFPLTASSYIIVAAHEPFAGTWADPMIIKVNGLSGDVISQSPKYDYQNLYIDDIAESILNINKKFIYSTGRLYLNGASMDQMRIFLTRFDTLGNNVWTHYFIYPSSSAARMYGECLLEDNDSIVIGYFGDPNGASANFEIGMVKTDSAGNMVWSKNYDIPSSNFERCFRIFKTTYGYAMVGFETGATEDLMILATDINGNVLWCKSYGNTTEQEENLNIFGSLPSTQQNGFIYFSGARVISNTENDLVLGKADQNGLVDCITNNNLNVTTTINAVFTDTRIVASTADPVNFLAVSSFNHPLIPSPCSSYSLNLGNDTTICNGSITLNATTPGATQYTWQDGSSNPTFTVTSSGSYSVIVQLNCCILRDTVQVHIGQSSVSNQDVSICSGDTFLFNGNLLVQTGTYIDTLMTVAGCDSIITVNLEVDSIPVISVSGGDTICSGQVDTLSAVGALSYLWSPPGGLSCTTCATTVATPSSSTTYLVTGTNAAGCTALDSVNVVVVPAPEITVSIPPIIYCNIPVQLNVTSNGNYSYTWSPAQYLDDPTSASPFANPPSDFTYTVSAIDSSGCGASGSVNVVVNNGGPIAIPSAFTPNNNGVNDIYHILHFCPVELVYFKIFDRWGELLFETSDITRGWDGTYNQINSPMDVYVYIILAREPDGNTIFLKGNVTLVR